MLDSLKACHWRGTRDGSSYLCGRTRSAPARKPPSKIHKGIYGYHRLLNILIYFNKDWKEEYGGYLDIWDKDVKKCYGAFAPIFNRACGFATSEISFHGVTPLTCPPDMMRRSFATYYYTKDAPEGWTGKVHSTIFKARPDECMRGHILMPAESSVHQARRGLQRVKKAVKTLVGK